MSVVPSALSTQSIYKSEKTMKPIIQKAVMLLAMLFAFASACAKDFDFEVNGLCYNIISTSELTVEVSGITDSTIKNVDIPETVSFGGRQLTVVRIVSNAFVDEPITTVNIPKSVELIGSDAFKNSSIESVKFPESCNIVIGAGAFRESSIESVEFPESGNIVIRDIAFEHCDSLKSIVIPKSVIEIGEEVFRYCSSLKNIVLPASDIKIGEGIFHHCYSLEKIVIPETITEIPRFFCWGCSKLTDIEMGQNVTSIGEIAFSGTAITEFVCPASLRVFSGFSDCENLKKIVFNESIESIGSRAFSGTKIESIELPNSVTYLPYNAFYDAENIRSITFGTGLDGLPFRGEVNLPLYSIGVEGIIKNNTWINNLHLENLENVKIVDSPDTFSLKLFCIDSWSPTDRNEPAFFHNHLKHFYVGRPLDNITECKYSNYKYTLSKDYSTNPDLCSIETLEIAGYCDDVPKFFQTVDTLILGKNVKKIDLSNINQSKLVTIICRNLTPPTVTGNFEKKVWLYATLKVPKGTKEIYANANGWKEFWTIEEYEPETKLMLKETEISLKPNETYQLIAELKSEDEDYETTLKWSSSDDAIVSVSDNGLVTGISAGQAMITVSTADDKAKATCIVNVNDGSGFADVSVGEKISIAAMDGTISVLNKPDGQPWYVFNSQGQLVSGTRDEMVVGLASGLYIVRVGEIVQKVVLP